MMDLIHVLLTADTVIQAAHLREESRGAHFREDFLEMEGSWKVNIICSKGQRQISLGTRTPADISETIRAALEENHTLSYHQLE